MALSREQIAMRIAQELKELLGAKGFTSLRDAIGFAHRVEEA